MAAEDEGFSFGDFNFATHLPQPINGGLIQDDDDDWGDFFVAPSQPRLAFSNGFSLPSQSIPIPPTNPKSSINFDPFSFNPTRHAADPSPTSAQKPRGALSLSLFGEVEDGIDEPDSIDSGCKKSVNGLLDPNSSAQNGKIEDNIFSNGGGFKNNGDLFAVNLHVQKQQIKPVIGLGLNSGHSGSTTAITMPSVEPTSAASASASDLNKLDGGDGEDDEWEFMDAFSGNGHVRGNKEQGASVLPGSKVEAGVVMRQQKQAGQDAPSSAEHKHDSNSSVPQFVDLFAAHPGAIHKSNKIDVGLNVSISNGFMPDFFHGVGAIGDGSEINAPSLNSDDDFDDFGDFVDASQDFGLQNQEPCIPQSTVAPNGKIQDQQTQPDNSKGPLPLSLFSDDLEESSDGLAHQEEVINEPISYPENGFGTQGPRLSIHDLLTNLYSQAQQTSTVNSNKSLAEYGVHSPQKTEDATPFGDDDDWDNNSWEFKGASLETGIKEQSFGSSLGTLPQTPSETTSNLQFYIDFCVKLKDSLCVLLSHQLNEEKKSQHSDTIGANGNSESLSHDMQEACRLLEGNIRTEEILSKKHLDRSHCLNEVLEVLEGSKCKGIESAYSLSERLPLAINDWRTAAELLRHIISVLHVLSLGSADEQSVYVSSWSKIISVCAQELKHGALIWKRAFEKNLQAQILSDHRGQQYIQALGEIYKVVELLGLSTKLYKPWMLLSVSDSQLLGLLEECESLWSSSGLEEALRNMSDNVGLGHNEAAKILIASIKNIHNIDELAVHECVFVQRLPMCRLSLLPQEMLPGLKVAMWDKEPYFLNLANLWLNLISRNLPQLPRLLMS